MATVPASRLVVCGPRPTDLRAIRDPDCALAIWNHPEGHSLHIIVDELDLTNVDDIDETIPVDGAALHGAVLLGAAGYPLATAVALASQIAVLVERFAIIADMTRARLRLEVVETDACRRFHADVVTMRMICTLRGPGTQWIEADMPDTIEQVPTGAVALFKGRLLVSDPPILHRSPPIADTGVQRLVLVIDPASDTAPPVIALSEPTP